MICTRGVYFPELPSCPFRGDPVDPAHPEVYKLPPHADSYPSTQFCLDIELLYAVFNVRLFHLRAKAIPVRITTAYIHLQPLFPLTGPFIMTKATEDAMISFDSLPLDPTGPRGNAWGRFGQDDQLGTLNLLTPERVVEAAKEIKTGVRISLDWPLSMPSYPSFNRNPFKHELILRSPNCIHDDTLAFNSQGSTQWDGFRHYGALLSVYGV